MITSIEIRDKCYNFSSDYNNLIVDSIEEIEKIYNSLIFASGRNILNLNLKGPGDVLFIKITFSDSTIMDLGLSEEQTYKLVYKNGKSVSKEINLDVNSFSDDYFIYRYNEEGINYINSVLSLYSGFSYMKLVSPNTFILEGAPKFMMSINCAGSGYKKSVDYLLKLWWFYSTRRDIVEKVFFLKQCLDTGLDRNLTKILLRATKDLGINLISLSL